MTDIDKELKKLQENAEIMNSLIDDYIVDEDRKAAIYEMLEVIGDNYLQAPASRRKSFHNSFYGGLFEHSVNVFMNLMKVNETFDLGFSGQEMLTVALFHDLGKSVAPNLKDPHYADSEEWKKRKLDQQFEPDYSSGYFTNRDRTMFVLQRFNIKLTPQEYQAILLNDGLMLEPNRAYCMQEYDLSFWTQVCDHWAAKLEKKELEDSN